MDIQRIQDSVNIDRLSDYIGIRTKAGRQALKEKTGQWTSDVRQLKQKSYEFATLQQTLQNSSIIKELNLTFRDLSEMESELDTLVEKASDLETEAFNELLFLQPWSQPFNFIPYLLAFWSALRVYIFPGMSLLMPLMMLIMPFIILRFMFSIPITIGRYTMILSTLFSGQITSLLDPNFVKDTPVSAVPFDFFQLFKSGFLLLTIGQSFLQPYWSYKHLSSIDSIITKKAKALLHFKALYEGTVSLFKEHGYTLSPIPFAPDITDPRQLVAHAHLHTVYLKTARKRLGALEALVCLAKQTEMVPVHWSDDRQCLELTDAYDYNVPWSIRKTFDISMDQETGHALLTGPNRGGKSTTLRSVLTSCLLAHTYGCAPASVAVMSPLNTLFVCLTPEDLPGQKSRFEREIEFTAQTLKANPDQRHLVLLDELYHSTNPPDAEKACRIYTERLWQKQNTMSIVSTHLFDFVEQAPKTIQRLCCPATVDGDVIKYSYRLTEGVCKVSSVQELLVENGLITSV